MKASPFFLDEMRLTFLNAGSHIRISSSLSSCSILRNATPLSSLGSKNQIICFLFPSMDFDIMALDRDFPFEFVNTIFVLFDISLGDGFSSTIFAISNPVCEYPKPMQMVNINFFIFFPFSMIFVETHHAASLQLILVFYHQRMAADAHVYPAPKAARMR